MDKREFLEKLENNIRGQLSVQEVNDNINYYNQYISEAVLQGRSEEEVIDELGGPQLVAKTLLEVNNYKYGTDGESMNSHQTYGADQGYDDGYAGQKTYSQGHDDEQMRRKGFHAEYSDQGLDIRFGKFKLNSWYGKLGGIILLVLFIVMLFTITTYIIPIVMPIIIIFVLLRIFLGNNRRY